jgi:hypothetical protein
MEPDADPDDDGHLITRRLRTDFDLDAVKNPVLAAVLARLLVDAPAQGRSFNNYIS